MTPLWFWEYNPDLLEVAGLLLADWGAELHRDEIAVYLYTGMVEIETNR